jgi:hypothetical protein
MPSGQLAAAAIAEGTELIGATRKEGALNRFTTSDALLPDAGSARAASSWLSRTPDGGGGLADFELGVQPDTYGPLT